MQLPEIVAAGMYDSNIGHKNTAVIKKRKTSMFEIELAVADGGVSYIEDGSFQITPKLIICAKPGQTRYTKFPFRCFYVHMLLHNGPLYDVLMNAPDFFETEKAEKYGEILKRIARHHNTPSEDEELMLQSLVLELVYTINKDVTKKIKTTASNASSTIETAIAYIKEHLTENLTLETVSKYVLVSPIYFHNTFKAAVGKTLREYVEEQRIKRAINLLIATNKSLTQIAMECGFSSQSYFSYAFKRKMKKTPREYVKEIYDKYENELSN